MIRNLGGKTPQIAESAFISESACISVDRDDCAYTHTCANT